MRWWWTWHRNNCRRLLVPRSGKVDVKLGNKYCVSIECVSLNLQNQFDDIGRIDVDFEMNRSQKQIQKAVKDFVKGEFKKEILQELTEGQKFPVSLWQASAELGFIGMDFPEEYEGQGLGVFEKVLVTEELCHGDSSVGGCLVRAAFGAEIILRYGSKEQKHTWLPKIAEGTKLSCRAYTEPGIGHGLNSLNTTAEKDGNQWIISGTKNYVINAGSLAGYYVVLCRTDSADNSSGKGLSTILVEADREGIEVEDMGKRIGGRLMFIGTVSFNKVKVPLENLIGKKNEGYAQVLSGMDETMVLSAAQSVGIAQGAFDRSFSHVKQREQFSKKLINFQVTQQKIADMATQIVAARLMTYKAAFSFNKGRSDVKLCAMAKYFAAKTAVNVCDEAIQLFGGYGYIEEYEVERFFRDAKFNDIFEGTEVTQKQIIANTLMKKSAMSLG